MQVLLCLNTRNFAGTERHVVDLCAALSEQGTDVRVAAVSGSELDKRIAAPIGNVPLKAGAIGLLINPLRLRKYLTTHPESVLHCHNGMTLLQAAIAKVLSGRGRLVLTQHFLSPARVSRLGCRKWLADRIHRRLQRRIDHTIAISDAVREALIARGEATPDRVTRVYNGSRVAPLGESCRASVQGRQPIIFCAARLEREKRVEVLIDAMALVTRSHSQVRCEIVGDGNDRDELQRRIVSLGLADRIFLRGFCTDVRTRLLGSDLFVLPADAEPFGLVVLEAMEAGRAVIACNAGGPKEIVVQGETGWLVPPNDVEALANAILASLADPEKTVAMGLAGRARVLSHFTAERMARETIEIYRRVINRSPAASSLRSVATTSTVE